MRSLAIFVLSFASLLDVHVHGWGPVGHSLVVRLAETQLNSSEFDWMRALVPWHLHGNMSAMASWPDVILYPNTNPIGYGNWLWTSKLHYIRLPDWNCSYFPEIDCPDDGCIEGALKNYTRRIVAPFDDKIDLTQRQEALFFLLHFVGDIHQPLHAGFRGDEGGNTLKGYFMNASQPTDLHWVWDNDILMYRLHTQFKSNVEAYFNYLYLLMMNLSSSSSPIENDDDIKTWIQEDIEIVCSKVYLDDNNETIKDSFDLGQSYFDRHYDLIDERIAKAGRRLATVLKRLKPEQPRTPNKDNSLCAGTIALIVILGVEFVIGLILGLILFLKKK